MSEDGRKQQAKLKELNHITEKLGCTLPQLAVGKTSPSSAQVHVHVTSARPFDLSLGFDFHRRTDFSNLIPAACRNSCAAWNVEVNAKIKNFCGAL